MGLPVGRALRNSRTEVVANLGAVPLLMPRYSLTYDMGLGVGVDAYGPAGPGPSPFGPVGPTPGGVITLSLGDEADLQAQIDAVANAMRLAQRGVDQGIPGQDVALAQLRNQYRVLSRQLAAARQAANAADVADAQPGVLQQVADAVRGFGGKVALVAAIGVGALVLLPLLTARRR